MVSQLWEFQNLLYIILTLHSTIIITLLAHSKLCIGTIILGMDIGMVLMQSSESASGNSVGDILLYQPMMGYAVIACMNAMLAYPIILCHTIL